jgi:hypothetical protein
LVGGVEDDSLGCYYLVGGFFLGEFFGGIFFLHTQNSPK